MAEIATEYKPATSEEFDSFVAFCDSENGWKLCWENKDKTVRVWEQPVCVLQIMLIITVRQIFHQHCANVGSL